MTVYRRIFRSVGAPACTTEEASEEDARAQLIAVRRGVGHPVRHCEAGDEDQRDRYISRAREGEVACKRDTGIKNHTVVPEVLPRTNDRAVALFPVVLEAPKERERAASSSQRQQTTLL